METSWKLTLTTTESDGRVEVSDISEHAKGLYLHGLSLPVEPAVDRGEVSLCSLEISGVYPWAPGVPEKDVLDSIARSVRDSIFAALEKTRGFRSE